MKPARTIAGGILLLVATACGGGRSDDQPSTAPTNATVAPPKTGQAESKIGVNVNTIAYWDGSRPFQNLIYGSDWQMQAPAGGARELPAEDLDANGWIKFLAPGYTALRVLSVPAASADVVCRWEGNDHNSMGVASNAGPLNFVRTAGANEVRFHYDSSYGGELHWAFLNFAVDPSDYVRNIDCHEDNAARTELYDPTLVSTLQGFRIIRFMKWQPAVEANTTVTWATRNKPGDGDYFRNDGVPVERMVALANQVGADPWFTVPWNADDDYVTRFAAYVRDNLAPGRQVYVEASNEVWNPGYPAHRQAQDEGVAEGLDASQGVYGQSMFRYAEKTQHVMQLWSDVFTGQMQRLVRVASTQNVNPTWSDRVLEYRDTAKYVDALATAPYWALQDSDYSGQTLDQVMESVLPARIADTLSWATQQKSVAQKYGKRYIAYEGGQHVALGNNEQLVGQIERDPRMVELYTSYLSQWNAKIGDSMALFVLTGPIVTAGFGLVEYAGQPDAQAPKMRAVRAFLGLRTG